MSGNKQALLEFDLFNLFQMYLFWFDESCLGGIYRTERLTFTQI